MCIRDSRGCGHAAPDAAAGFFLTHVFPPCVSLSLIHILSATLRRRRESTGRAALCGWTHPVPVSYTHLFRGQQGTLGGQFPHKRIAVLRGDVYKRQHQCAAAARADSRTERSTALLPQLHAQERRMDSSGWLWMARGFAKKLLLADTAAVFVDSVYRCV